MHTRVGLLVLLLVLPATAFAAPFGTRTWVQLAPFDESGEAQASDTRIEPIPATAASWLANGESFADAVAPFGSNFAAVLSAPGALAYAASLWSDTFVLTSDGGATGSAAIAFQLRFGGSVDAGSTVGGFAHAALRAVIGVDVDNDDPGALTPNVVLGAAHREAFDACGPGPPVDPSFCDPSVVAVDDVLELASLVQFGVPFRFAVLLEARGENGGSATLSPGSWLDRITLPPGTALHAASSFDYASVTTVVPEPGSLLLLGMGLALLGRRAAR